MTISIKKRIYGFAFERGILEPIRWIRRIVNGPHRHHTDLPGHHINETELQAITANLNKKDELLQGVVSATHELICNDDLEAAIGGSIRFLGFHMRVDGVNVYKCDDTDPIVKLPPLHVARWSAHSNVVEYGQKRIHGQYEP